ncbi:hypothetical protein KM176_07660 [Pseudooceanicola sp. CBS1P-1]|uniref:Type IV pilus biogenesis n=1 Tax=Pseudooceanicola albus TaxID=2692189 RepID=A0A6L7G1J7_9RHOB|nr:MULTISPECIES: hypothetical protein [Pseudooceanicola]MBT9383728.1 hypothetical protein [Pseudooceanicola endophyticus]MXN17582.1 hypothetical protein [Pseudooceanicola albus]
MRPNFALNFLPEGLDLLHRLPPAAGAPDAASRWETVGHVPFEAPRFAEGVAALKARAAELYPAPYYCTLVLPRDQVRFLEAVVTGTEEIEDQVRARLDGATPYPLEDLAYCWQEDDDGRLRIAAIALETLEEAERFAIAQGFAPVTFMAQGDPEDSLYPEAPWFGATFCAETLLEGESPEPERGEPVFPLTPGPELAEARSAVPLAAPQQPGTEPVVRAAEAALHQRPDPVRAPAAPQPSAGLSDESSRMTVFGARGVRGPTPAGGLLRGLILLLVLIALALGGWLALKGPGAFSDLRLLFGAPSETGDVLQSPAQTTGADAPVGDDSPQARDPHPTQIASGQVATPAEARARYGATGIWQRAPAQSPVPQPTQLGQITFPQITAADRVGATQALPAPPGLRPGTGFRSPPNPPPADEKFALDSRGLVPATTDGAETPQGVMVYAGHPEVLPPATVFPEAPVPEAASDPEAADPATAPGADTPVANGPVTAPITPRKRPEGLVPPEPEAPPVPEGSHAAEEGLRPRPRPENFQAKVAAAQAKAAAAPPAPTPSAQTVVPARPSPASVARTATDKNELNLKQVNLLGVTGSTSKRTALVRLGDGNVVRVKVGDTLDGGRVAAIGETQLRYIKNGRNILLQMP